MDTVKYENRYEITKQFIRSEHKLTQKRSGKLTLWLRFFTQIFMASYVLACFILGNPLNILSVIFMLCLCFMFVSPYFIALNVPLNAYKKRSGESKPCKTIYRTVRFGENIELQTGNSISSYSYDKVRYIEDNKECIYFWINLVFVSVVPLLKNSFTVGNADEFLLFFKEKCSEQEPLWTKGELYKRQVKEILSYINFLPVLIVTGIFF